MADPEVRISIGDSGANEDDVQMQRGDSADVMEVGETAAVGGNGAEEEETVTMEEEGPAARLTFVDYLKSPIVELAVGSGESLSKLTAHQTLLEKSPYLAEELAGRQGGRIELADHSIDAVGCFLEYLYTGEYFPKKTTSGSLEHDPSVPTTDNSGDQLLKHAKVYTLAEKFGMAQLKTLSHSKIHLVTSTALAEIAYARYVYSHTARTDLTIRKPVASFWGQRSHVLRHETEGSFRAMCLEYPEFAFDVLSFVLDAEEKRARREEDVGRSGKKRARG